MRGRISSKSYTCTESMYVYATGISVKAGAHYPGKPVRDDRCQQKPVKDVSTASEG